MSDQRKLQPRLADFGLLEAFAAFIKSQDAGHSAPQILYVDAALPEATGASAICFGNIPQTPTLYPYMP